MRRGGGTGGGPLRKVAGRPRGSQQCLNRRVEQMQASRQRAETGQHSQRARWAGGKRKAGRQAWRGGEQREGEDREVLLRGG